MNHDSLDDASQDTGVANNRRVDRCVASPAVSIACVPSPLGRVLNDLEAELQNRELSPDKVTQLCDRLLDNLQLHFQADESTGALRDLDGVDPGARVEVERCFDTHQRTLDQATQLLHRSRDEKRGLRWQRQLNRDFHALRLALNSQQRKELELVRQAYRLDVKESD
jgi:hypothetical protein